MDTLGACVAMLFAFVATLWQPAWPRHAHEWPLFTHKWPHFKHAWLRFAHA